MAGGINLPEGQFTIKQASILTGISEHILRHWDRRSVFVAKRVKRKSSMYRYYTSKDIEILRLLKTTVRMSGTKKRTPARPSIYKINGGV